jgi:hypothetical protein
MTSFDDIPGLSPDLVPVFQTAGIDTPADLAVVPAKVIRRAIEKAMDGKGAVPTIQEVERWQSAVRAGLLPEVRTTAPQSAVRGPSGPGYSLGDPLLVAVALSSRQLMASGIAASAVPVARILGDVSEETLSAPTMSEDERRERLLHPDTMGSERLSPRDGVQTENGAAAVENVLPESKPVEVTPVEPSIREPLPTIERVEEAEEEEEPGSIVFSSTDERAREQTDFERKNRGMTHKDPMRVYCGALATLLALVLAIVGIGTVVTASVLEFVLKKPVPVELAFGLLAFPFALIVFVWLGAPARCRLCGQRLYMPRSCRRHERAHQSILGYSISLAAHVVVYRWFRCSLCGTKQRLKQ